MAKSRENHPARRRYQLTPPAQGGKAGQTSLLQCFRDQRARSFSLCRGRGVGSRDVHRLPVVGEFAATVEASHVGSASRPCSCAPRTSADRKRKAVAGMTASEHRIHDPCEHVRLHTKEREKIKIALFTNLFTTLDSILREKVRHRHDRGGIENQRSYRKSSRSAKTVARKRVSSRFLRTGFLVFTRATLGHDGRLQPPAQVIG